MARITIALTPEEKAALVCYAKQQRRDPRNQAALEIQQILERAGFLAPSTAPAMESFDKPGLQVQA